jgi:hypothetical protein
VSGVPFEARDFTLAAYGRLCASLTESGYASLGLADYLGRPPAERPERCVLLRHDVESSPAKALAMGELERRHGLVASYFFRTKRAVFQPQAIRALVALGHEIGYHYETLGRCLGRLDAAVALFGRELARLREHADVRVASMHGAPLSPWDNRDIWSKARPRDFGLVGEVYLDLDYASVSYFSDTGRTWHPRRYNIRDHPPAPPGALVDTTQELIALVLSRRLPRLCLLVHPDRWAATGFEWRARALRDGLENRAKIALKALYDLARGRPARHAA